MESGVFDLAIDRLRETGHRVTRARRAVLRILCDSDRHLTSAEILERARTRDASVGRASVFRTLDLFTELSIIRPTYLEPRTPNYVVLPASGHHAHLVCPQCHQVSDLGECEIQGFVERVAERHRVQISGHLLELYGPCASCAQTASAGE